MPIQEAKTSIIASSREGEDSSLDVALRPATLSEFIGQAKLKNSLGIFLKAAQQRSEPLEHVLLAGPPGLGKTSLANIIAREMGANIRITAGPVLTKVADLAAVLTNLQNGDILFIDEIHRLSRSVEEVLYPAMESYALDLIVGQGPGAKTLRLDLPTFTLVGATTRVGMLGSPLRDRFGMTYRLEFYSEEEMCHIVERSSQLLHINIEKKALYEIARRCRSTPRIGNRILKRVRDYAQVGGHSEITLDITREALALLGVDLLGLDSADRKMLHIMVKQFNGGPVGIQTLAAVSAEEDRTIEEVIEPFLLQRGLIIRTPRGREVTQEGERHIEEYG